MSFNPLRRVLLSTILLAAIAQAAVAASPQAPAGRVRLHMPAIVALQQAVTLATDPRGKSLISEPEFAFLRDAANGRGSNWSIADAALICSGVTEQDEREHYLAKFDAITEQAREATATAETAAAKAKALGAFLCKEPLHGGYTDAQVNMCRLLDEGKFQCVSSAILFNIVGRRLGLNPVPCVVPGHAFVRVENFYAEPTSGKVYSEANHERIVDKEWAKANPLTAELFGDTRIYETNNLGLIAQVYYDLAIYQGNDGKYGGKTVFMLKAISLDPHNPVFGSVMERSMKKWFAQTVREKQFGKAASIAKLYVQLVGDQKIGKQMFQEISVAANSGKSARPAQRPSQARRN